jgi:WD40 repeat protein/serine/threonine protein kinase
LAGEKFSEVNQVDEIFMTAREITAPRERSDYVVRACAGDSELLAQIHGLLREADGADAYFGAADGLLEVSMRHDPSEMPGTVIGRYVLEERIGEGGMGVVYRARQTEPIVRHVALKIIKWGMDTRRMVARFEAERQALALMDHSNIARVFDAGATEKGRPYFVMELVRGCRITDYCDRHRLSIRRRIALFLPVCMAVQHAHQKGILHRDLKPSNVLVEECAPELGDGLPKIIDFGVAKVMHSEFGMESHTATGVGPVGTLAYMSPEQAAGSVSDVDTRSDIYSLGVVLYELLVGPTGVGSEGVHGRGRAVDAGPGREFEFLPPSERFAKLPPQERESVAEARAVARGQLKGELRGDLDWVVMKCLEKDRSRRYATASELARDLQRHLADEAVEARPASLGIRLSKMARRNRATVAATGAVALALVVGTVVSAISARRARSAEREQESLRHKAEAVSRELTRELYISRMSQAELFWDRGEFIRLRKLLVETSDSPERGFEWHYWMRLAHLEDLTYRGHRGSISAVALSRDGRHALSGDGSPSLQWWDTATGRKLQDFAGLREPVKCVAILPDGATVLSGGLDGRLRWHDVGSGKQVRSVAAHEGGVLACATAADGEILLTGGMDGQVKVWLGARPESPRVLASGGDPVSAVALSGDGRRFAAARSDRRLILGDMESGASGELLSEGAAAEISYALAFTPGGGYLAAGDKRGEIKLWEVATRRRLWVAQTHRDAIASLAVSPDGKRVYSAGADHFIAIRDVERGTLLGTLRGHSSRVNALALNASGTRLLSGASDAAAKVWDMTGDDLDRFAPMTSFSGHSDWLQGICFLPDNHHVLTFVNGAWLWDVQGGRHKIAFEGHRHMIFAKALTSDGARLVTAGDDHTVRVWSVADGHELQRIDFPGGIIRRLAFFPDDRRILAGSDLGELLVIDPGHGGQVAPLARHAESIGGVAFSRDGRWLAVGGGHGWVQVRDGVTLEPKRELSLGSESVVSLDFSPVEPRLLVGLGGSVGSRIIVVDVMTGRLLMQRSGGLQTLHSATYSADGIRILAVSESSTGDLLDGETGRELLSLRGGSDLHRAGALSPDGRRIVLGTLGLSRDHEVRVWEAADPDQTRDWLSTDRGWMLKQEESPFQTASQGAQR